MSNGCIPTATETHLHWRDTPFRELVKKISCYIGTEIPQKDLCLRQEAAHKVYPWFGLTFQSYQCLSSKLSAKHFVWSFVWSEKLYHLTHQLPESRNTSYLCHSHSNILGIITEIVESTHLSLPSFSSRETRVQTSINPSPETSVPWKSRLVTHLQMKALVANLQDIMAQMLYTWPVNLSSQRHTGDKGQ